MGIEYVVETTDLIYEAYEMLYGKSYDEDESPRRADQWNELCDSVGQSFCMYETYSEKWTLEQVEAAIEENEENEDDRFPYEILKSLMEKENIKRVMIIRD